MSIREKNETDKQMELFLIYHIQRVGIIGKIARQAFSIFRILDPASVSRQRLMAAYGYFKYKKRII